MAGNSDSLPALGIVSYNAGGLVTFNASTETVNFELRPQYDTAGRAVVYSDVDMTFRTIINEAPVSPLINSMVAILEKPAGVLVINGHNLGNWGINIGGVKDCVWGPKPVSVQVKPYGNDQTSELIWRVKFGIPTCNDALYTGIMEFCFKLKFGLDKSGYTTRHYSAILRIAQTRQAAAIRLIADSADAYRDKATPKLIPGFRRASQSYDLSHDKCTLNVEITDEQMSPNIPKNGVSDCDAEHSLSVIPKTQVVWTGTLSGTYEMVEQGGAFPFNRSMPALSSFFSMAVQRMNILNKTLKDKKKPGTWLPLAFRISEPKIFGRTMVRIEMSYMIANASLDDILQKVGLWTLIGNKWVDWVKVEPFAAFGANSNFQGNRGTLGLGFAVTDDQIVDLCAAVKPISPGASESGIIPGVTPPSGSPSNQNQDFDDQLQQAFPPPPSNQSWIHFENKVYTECDQGTVVGQTLPTTQIQPSQVSQQMWDSFSQTMPTSSNSGPFAFPPAGDLVSISQQSGSETFVQQRVPPKLYLTIAGTALRAGYVPPTPNLITVNGQPVTPVNRPNRGEGIWQGIVGVAANGVQIYGSRWVLRYVVTDPFSGPMPVPTNPLLTL